MSKATIVIADSPDAARPAHPFDIVVSMTPSPSDRIGNARVVAPPEGGGLATYRREGIAVLLCSDPKAEPSAIVAAMDAIPDPTLLVVWCQPTPPELEAAMMGRRACLIVEHRAGKVVRLSAHNELGSAGFDLPARVSRVRPPRRRKTAKK